MKVKVGDTSNRNQEYKCYTGKTEVGNVGVSSFPSPVPVFRFSSKVG